MFTIKQRLFLHTKLRDKFINAALKDRINGQSFKKYVGYDIVSIFCVNDIVCVVTSILADQGLEQPSSSRRDIVSRMDNMHWPPDSNTRNTVVPLPGAPVVHTQELVAA